MSDTDKAMPDEIWFKPYGGVHLENPECGYSKYIRHDLALPTEAALVEALEVARVCLISSMHTELMVGKGIIRKQGFTVGSEVIDRAYAEQFFNDSATGKIINEALKAQKGGA